MQCQSYDSCKNKKKYVSAPISSQNRRPRFISDRAAREIAHCIRSGCYKTPKIAAQEIEISASELTIRRSLKRIGFRAKEKESKPALPNKNITKKKITKTLLTPSTKNGRPKIGKELYGVTKQKLTDSNPTEGPGILDFIRE